MLKAYFTSLCLIAIIAALPARPEDQQRERAKQPMISVQAASIQIGQTVEGNEDGNDYMAMGFAPGSKVYLLLKANRGRIIAQDWSMRNDSISDDLGNDMMPKLPKGPNKPPQGGLLLSTHRDGELATLYCYASRVPGKGAESIRVKGDLTFYHASKQATHQQTVDLVAGKEIAAGPIRCVLTRTDVRDGDKPSRSVTLDFPDTMPGLAEVDFYREKGGKLKKYVGYSGTYQDKDGNLRKTMTFLILPDLDRALIRFTVWTDLNQITLPLDMKMGLDLAGEAKF